MKIYFIKATDSNLASSSNELENTRNELINTSTIEEVTDPSYSDIILLQEKNSFKNFRYKNELFQDPIVSRYPEKVFTINTDDWATGLLRGLYTSLPVNRFNPSIHAAIPYMTFPNEKVFETSFTSKKPKFLASWRGNVKSNKLRRRIVNLFEHKEGFKIEKTDRWLDHSKEEKNHYVELLQNSKFSICPSGWAPVSYRIYESMALGRCPVIISDSFVPPKGPNWKDFALFYPENKISGLPDFLRKNESLAEYLGENAAQAWDENFSQKMINKYYANTLLSLLKTCPKSTKYKEINRWNAFNTYWTNEWTIPQRIINKLSRNLTFKTSG